MNKLKTTDVGGFPFVLNDLRFMHQSYLEAFKGSLSAYGIASTDAVILSGVIRNLQTGNVFYSEGYVFLGGEIFYFPAQSYAAPLNNEEEYLVLNVTYDPAGAKVLENAQTIQSYEVRQAKMIVAASLPTGGVVLGDLKRFYDVINSNINSVPVGIISMWSGSISAIPNGYSLCDGQNGTPNLSGKFIVAYKASDTDYNAIGKIGGEKEHTLIESEMPSHKHDGGMAGNFGSQYEFGPNPTAGGKYATAMDVNPGAWQRPYTSTVGGGGSHENRPPYYTLAYIIKI